MNSSNGISHSHYISRVYFHYESSDVQQRLYTWKIFHIYYSDGVSPLCILWWLIRVEFFLKILPHWLYQYGFSSVWIFICSTRVKLSLKTFAPSLHIKRSFSTMYILSWWVRATSEHRLSHSLYISKGFWLVWILCWLKRIEFFLKAFPHSLRL